MSIPNSDPAFGVFNSLAAKADLQRSEDIDNRQKAREYNVELNEALAASETNELIDGSDENNFFNSLKQPIQIPNSPTKNSPDLSSFQRRTTLSGLNSFGPSNPASSEDIINLQRANLLEIRALNSKLEESNRSLILRNSQIDSEIQMLRYELELKIDELDELREQQRIQQQAFTKLKRESAYQRMQVSNMRAQIGFMSQQIASRDGILLAHNLMPVDEIYDEENGQQMAIQPTDLPRLPFRSVAHTPQTCFSSMVLSRDTCQELARISGNLQNADLDHHIARLIRSNAEASQIQEEFQQRIKELENRLANENTANSNSAANHQLSLDNNGSFDYNDAAVSNHDFIKSLKSQVQEYKRKLHEAEQLASSLQSDVTRLNGQVKRHSAAAEAAQENEEAAKAEKRRFQRELRNLENQLEDVKMEKNMLLRKLGNQGK